VLAEIDRYGLPLRTVLCMECGTLRADPYLDESALSDFYNHLYQELYDRSSDPAAYFEKQRHYGRSILAYARSFLTSSDRVLEIGCGAGGAVSVFQEAGFRAMGCDFSAELVKFGTSRGVERLDWGSPLELLQRTAGPERPTFVYMHHVFEHLPEPLEFLDRLRAMLTPASRVLVVVPDIARIHRFAFPGGDARLFLHVAHCFNFSHEGLRRMVRRAGLRLTDMQEREAHGAPELWALFQLLEPEPAGEHEPDAGLQMLRYMRRTERLYRWRLNPAQLRALPARLTWLLYGVLRKPLRLARAAIYGKR
jgi:SAM-dependent methyltransferase